MKSLKQFAFASIFTISFGLLNSSFMVYKSPSVVKIALAAKLYERAKKGDIDAQFELGKNYYNNSDYPNAVEWFSKAAQKGHAGAQNYLGFCYYNGNGVTQNYAEAVKWFTRAAQQGNDKAQYNLGLCYYYGKGVLQNTQEAIKWYRMAEKQGNESARPALATIFNAKQNSNIPYVSELKKYSSYDKVPADLGTIVRSEKKGTGNDIYYVYYYDSGWTKQLYIESCIWCKHAQGECKACKGTRIDIHTVAGSDNFGFYNRQGGFVPPASFYAPMQVGSSFGGASSSSSGTKRTCPSCNGKGKGMDQITYRTNYTGTDNTTYCSICGSYKSAHTHSNSTCTVCHGRGYLD